MSDSTLKHRRILVVEDEWLLADELAQELSDLGASVLGPAPTVARAMALLGEATPDGAILDLNLGGEPAFPLVETLIDRGVPLIFTTGYDASSIPVRFAHVPRCEKPMSITRIVAALANVLATGRSPLPAGGC